MAAGEPWPAKLQTRQNLRLSRGDVLVLDRVLHAVVAFDGRNEEYLCWASDHFGEFDTTRCVPIDRLRAHSAPRDLTARERVPHLPPLDHTGRIMGMGPEKPRRFLEKGLRQDTAETLSSSGPSGPLKGPSSRSSAADFFAGGGKGDGDQCDADGAPAKLPGGGIAEGVEHGLALVDPKPTRVCVLCLIARCVFGQLRAVGSFLWWSVTGPSQQSVPGGGAAAASYRAALQQAASRAAAAASDQRLREEAAALQLMHAPTGAYSMTRKQLERRGTDHSIGLRRSDAGEERMRHDTFADLNITIPIVKPPGWSSVQPFVDGNAVTFDERGIRETMTVKHSRWCGFVDRQKAKIERELEQMRARGGKRQPAQAPAAPMTPPPAPGPLQEGAGASTRFSIGTPPGEEGGESEGVGDPVAPQEEARAASKASSAASQHDSPRDRAIPSDDDIQELEDMLERMEDWKDLARYSGKSISMASTKHGNEMRIHVMAFAERESGDGIDFMRVSYKKSVEVHEQMPRPKNAGIAEAFGNSLRALLPFIKAPQESSEEAREQVAQLLRRPDVAKFTIALAFRDALASDGVHLQFCDAQLDDPRMVD